MKKLIVLLLSISAFVFSANAQVKNINVTAFEKGISELGDDIILLDVRSKKEVKVGYIKGMKNIDFYETDFETKIDLLDKSKTYYVYCAAGGRSFKAAKMLHKKGVKNVYNLNGGITAWRNENKAIVTK